VDEELAMLLLAMASKGELMPWLTDSERAEEERRQCINCMAELHSAGRINAFEHIRRPPEQDEWRLDYGSWSRVYRDLVPLLDDEAGRVVSAVVSLGIGLWEPTFHEAVLDWCVRDRKRIDSVLALPPNPDVPDFCFAAALIAGLRTNPSFYLEVAIDYARGNRRSRMPGIRAMGAMSIEDNTTVQRAVSVLGGVVQDKHAPTRDRADALTAAVEVAQRCGGSMDSVVSAIVAIAAVDRQAELLHACSHLLVRFGRQLRDALLPSLLEALVCLSIDGGAGRSPVDMPLYSLFTNGRREEALSCLETLLRNSAADDPLEALGSTTHYLATATADLLPTVICRWLLTGERTLCAAARKLLTSSVNQNLAFDFDPGNQDWSDIRTVYLARKAIGWLMPHATAPASFLACLLRHAGPTASAELGELLFDPILVNYPLAARAYLEAVCPSLPVGAKARVEEVLARDDSYKRAIDDAGFVPELQPTERHRWIENQRQGEEWAKARNKVEGKSVLTQLFTRRTMLYGTRAISYVDDPGGGTRRFDNRLGTISHTAHNAMGWVYDPCGLDFVLRIFRAERKPE
jgi:hypothetical protein